MEKEKILEEVKAKFGEKIKDVISQFGAESIIIEKDALHEIVSFLKNKSFSFTMLLDLTCVDWKGDEERFEMVYHLFSLSHNLRLRIKARLHERDPHILSLTPFWKNANWLEREVYDMFGIYFDGHPDLRRLFMYDGFEGHPLRKDYPLRKRQPRIPMRK